MELTQEQMNEIDTLFETITDKETLLTSLDKYKSSDGSFSLYIRWQLDSYNF